jgi:aspartate racemase
MMHKRIGILGGLTAESTLLYYQHIVRRYQELAGDHGYPEIVIYSVSFQQFEDWMEREEWEAIAGGLATALDRLAAAGADFAVMATNTMHLLFERLARTSPIPMLSIVEATADAIASAGLKRVALLGTRFTMEKAFYVDGLARRGIAALVPDAPERAVIHRVIMEELARGVVTDESRRTYLGIVDRLASNGAEGAVLGCTEIPLLLKAEHTRLPLFDTAVIHAEAALRRAIAPAEAAE